MKTKVLCCLALAIGLCGAIPGLAAAQDGWMRRGVRVWYLGAVDGGSITSSNAEQAFLFDVVSGGNATLIKHSALNQWNSPRQVETATYPVLDMGPCWIHPLRLQTLQEGDYWMGQEITLVVRTPTYATLPYQFLPAKALIGLNPARELVKIIYMIPGFSTGVAYFDADTGILLYYNSLWGTNKMFFILSEINYDFAQQVPVAEIDGPHTGFKSFVSEQSLGSTWGVGGGSVIIQSLVESRYGATVEMRVLTAITAPSYPAGTGELTQADENYCFFGDVPILRRMDALQAPNYPPEQWNPFGQYLWWWLPPVTSQTQTINVFDVPMARAANQTLTFTATEQPSRFFFSTIWFGNDGYMTAFSARNPANGLDLKPTDMFFQNLNSVDGVSYYRNTMAPRPPIFPRNDFTGDSRSDLLWRHATGGDIWLWPMDGATHTAESWVQTVGDTNWEIRGLGDQNGDGLADLLWRNKVNGQIYLWLMDGAARIDEVYVDTVSTGYDIVGTGDFDGNGRSDILWRHAGSGDVWIWLMNGPLRVSQTFVDRVDATYTVKGVGDFDGNHKADIVWQGSAGDTWVWLMNGAARQSQALAGTVNDTGYQIQAVTDFTGDGKDDLLWWHATRGEVWIWTMNGGANVAPAWVGNVSDTGYRIAGTGDYDGDGQADILWHHNTRGEVWVWLMDGAVKRSEHYAGAVPDGGYRIVR